MGTSLCFLVKEAVLISGQRESRCFGDRVAHLGGELETGWSRLADGALKQLLAILASAEVTGPESQASQVPPTLSPCSLLSSPAGHPA